MEHKVKVKRWEEKSHKACRSLEREERGFMLLGDIPRFYVTLCTHSPVLVCASS